MPYPDCGDATRGKMKTPLDWRHVDARGRRLARLAVSQSAGKSHHWQRAAWLLAGRRQHTPLRILADARGRRAHCNGAPDLHGRRSEVQPFKYAFGGEPAPRDYGRTIADGALLILLACFGLAEHGHETTPEVMQFAFVSMWLYGWVRSLDCPVQGALWWGGALGLLALASSPPLAVALLAGSLLWMLFTREFRPAFSFRLGIAIALGVMVLWLGAAWSAFPENTHHYLRAWSAGGVERFNAFSARALIYALKNLPLFAWP